MWFADELPPTYQEQMRNPFVLQSKMMLQHSLLQQLRIGEQRNIAEAQTRRFRAANSRVGKRVKTSRH